MVRIQQDGDDGGGAGRKYQVTEVVTPVTPHYGWECHSVSRKVEGIENLNFSLLSVFVLGKCVHLQKSYIKHLI